MASNQASTIMGATGANEDPESTATNLNVPKVSESSTTKQPREEIADAKESSKKQRAEGGPVAVNHPTPSYILEGGPQFLQHVRSFLSLKECLALRTTCKQLFNDGNDAFRYCNLQNDAKEPHVLTRKYVKYAMFQSKEVSAQQHLLCGIVFDDTNKLRALLRNTTFHGNILRYLLWNLIEDTTVDNGEAVTILLQDGRCQVEEIMFEVVVRKDFGAMAAALEQHDTVKAAIQVCTKCNTNPGIYECHRLFDCTDLAQADQDDENAWNLPKYCRPCALASGGKFCAQCEDWLCPKCLKAKNCDLCKRCGVNIFDKEDCTYQQGIDICAGCGRKECQMCTAEYGNNWHHCCGFNPPCYCPKCKVKPKYAAEFDY